MQRVRGLFFLLVVGTGLAVFYFGVGNYQRLSLLSHNVSMQREKNGEIKQQVEQLRREVRGLQTDDRVLEQAARNELGMARKDEYVIIFNDSK